jgi:CBS-domain-containing membrane protein
VLDKDDKLAGIVTEGDFLRRAEIGTQKRRSRWLEFLVGPGRLAEEYAHANARKVGEVMTSSPHTVTEDASMADAAGLMERHHIKRLPVMRGAQVIGIVSRANFLRAIASATVKSAEAPLSDAAICDRLTAELQAMPWTTPNLIEVAAKDGVVDLWGSIIDERTRKGLVVAAENIPGVKLVRDHLVYIEPVSGTVIESPTDMQQAAKAS